MFDSINIGTTGLIGFSKQLQAISNDVANLNTPGYKGSKPGFTDFFSGGGSSAVGGQSGSPIGGGLATLPSVVNFTQGQINQTGNDLDVAVSGNGFFILHDTISGQTLYTRDGQFKFDADGFLVNSTGTARVQAFNSRGALQDISLNGLSTNPAKASTTITLSGTLSTADTSKLVSGLTVTDAAGGTHTLTAEFANNTATTAGSWLVTIKDGFTVVGTGEVRFSSGLLDAARSSVSFTYSPSGVTPLPLTLTLDSSSTSAASGTSSLALSTVDGNGQGTITNQTFDATGKLVITYTNGQTSNSQQLALATFNAPSDLRPVGGNSFKTDNPKGVRLGVAQAGTTSISANALEGSNVDLSTEFSAIIVTQRGYQASSELVSTANQMIETLMQMKGQG